MNKIVVASVVDWLFRKHNIFTFFNNNKDVAIMFAPSLIINKEEVETFFNALDEVFDRSLIKITGEFVKNKLLKVWK